MYIYSQDFYNILSMYNIQIMGNATEFHRAAQLVVDHVSFDRCTTVQVFEATIRYICICYILMCAPSNYTVKSTIDSTY